MRDVRYYIEQTVFEGRPPGSKNKPKEGKVVKAEDIDADDIKKTTMHGKEVPASKQATPGKHADENGTNGLYETDAPTPKDEAEWEGLDPNTMSENASELANAIGAKKSFFVMGEAGWAKTGLITKMAKRAGYHVITVYMAHAAATDIGGIPTPVKDKKSGKEYTVNLLPTWALEILNHPKNKYLLFFDELNQATPDVLNGLMPIVLRHVICGVQFDNILVGAAGNLPEENEAGVTDITANKPLWKRFPWHIEWVTNTDDSWKDHFEWAHEHWDDKIGAEVIDKLDEMHEYLSSPRDITTMIYEWVEQYKGKKVFIKTEKLYKHLIDFCLYDKKYKASDSEVQTKFQELAEFLIEYVNGNTKKEETSSSRSNKRKADLNIDKDVKEEIERSLSSGIFHYDGEKFICTLENVITSLFNPEETGVTAEVLKHIVKDMEANGKSVKFKTNKEGFAKAKELRAHTIETKNGVDYVDGKEQ